jgi:diacylglycerol kinase
MRNFFLTRALAFRYACEGWWYVLRSQRNAWIHAVISLLVVAVGLWLGISRVEWAVIVIAIALVWLAEFLNTALEAVVDLASPEQHRLAKIGKDVGAAAVLIAAGAATVIGLIILGPPLWMKIRAVYR